VNHRHQKADYMIKGCAPYTMTGAGGVQNESQDRNGMHGLQAEELQYQEEQEERSRQDRNEEVL
jgi:hypothetical protein